MQGQDPRTDDEITNAMTDAGVDFGEGWNRGTEWARDNDLSDVIEWRVYVGDYDPQGNLSFAWLAGWRDALMAAVEAYENNGAEE